MTLTIGQKAPNFSLPAIDKSGEEKVISLNDLSGKKVVLYFYPKDDTPGCTKEACQFRDLHEDFADKNTVILGVSKDNIKKHTKFIEKYDLPFYLISDVDGELCESYGVWVEKSMYGKKYMGIQRATFTINEDGVIENIWDKVKVPEHAQKVLDTIA